MNKYYKDQIQKVALQGEFQANIKLEGNGEKTNNLTFNNDCFEALIEHITESSNITISQDCLLKLTSHILKSWVMEEIELNKGSSDTFENRAVNTITTFADAMMEYTSHNIREV